MTNHLFFQHNLNDLSLLKAISPRNNISIPAASVACVFSDEPLLTYGKYTLIVNPDVINFKRDLVHTSDIFSARMPHISFALNRTKLNDLNQAILGAYDHYKIKPNDLGYNQDVLGYEIVKGYGKNESWMKQHIGLSLLFLNSQSLPLKLFMKDKESPVEYLSNEDFVKLNSLDVFKDVEAVKNIDSLEFKKAKLAIAELINAKDIDESLKAVYRQCIDKNIDDIVDYGASDLSAKEIDSEKVLALIAKKLSPKKVQQQFHIWLYEEVQKCLGEPYFTNEEGDDLDVSSNLVKYLNQFSVNDEGYAYHSVGSLRSLLSTRLKSFSELVSNKDSLCPKEEMDALKDMHQERFREIASEFHKYIQDDISLGFQTESECFIEELSEGLKRNLSVRQALSDCYKVNAIPNKLYQKLDEALGQLRCCKTHYFEAKLKKPLPLKDCVIVMPHNADYVDLKIAQDSGLSVVFYKNDQQSDNNRKKVIKKALNSCGYYLHKERSNNKERSELAI